MMSFIHQNTMRSTGLQTPLLQLRQQFQKEGRAILERKPNQIHDNLRLWSFEGSDHLGDRRASLGISEDDHFLHRRVISFGINDADLITLVNQLLENGIG